MVLLRRIDSNCFRWFSLVCRHLLGRVRQQYAVESVESRHRDNIIAKYCKFGHTNHILPLLQSIMQYNQLKAIRFFFFFFFCMYLVRFRLATFTWRSVGDEDLLRVVFRPIDRVDGALHVVVLGGQEDRPVVGSTATASQLRWSSS